MKNTFGSQGTLSIDTQKVTIHRLSAVEKAFPEVARLPYSLKILLENLLRTEDGLAVRPADIENLAKWQADEEPTREIAFTPSRVLLQDFTGVPAVVDLAAMRDAIPRLGGDSTRINPLQPVELVIDHSVQVDDFGSPLAFGHNTAFEFERNQERYRFLRWGQGAFRNFKVVPPQTGIVHQVNLEFLARVVFVTESPGPEAAPLAYPDTLVGTDSHTTMINGLGVLGWGVGGIEAEAAMLGQPVSMLIPQVVGFRLFGQLSPGATATDLVLTVTQMLRKKGVVGKFVEFFGEGLAELPLADRATIANMAPEYGATCGIFPVDAETLRYLRTSGRPEGLVNLVEAYYKEQGLFHTADTPVATYSDTMELDLSTVEPSLAGPRRPQDRVALADMKRTFLEALPTLAMASAPKTPVIPMVRSAGEGMATSMPVSPLPEEVGLPADTRMQEKPTDLHHGSVVIAAITSCTNTSNPSVMLAAGLLAKKAAEKGLEVKQWVKTSLAPGSKVVTEYLQQAGVMEALETLRFHVVGYGCTTCIGNSGPLPSEVSAQIDEKQLVAVAVLSGNRNFEGRVHPEVRANYLASPPLVVAYALAGRVDIDFDKEPIGKDTNGEAVYLKDIWPSRDEVNAVVEANVSSDLFRKAYTDVYRGDEHWNGLEVPTGDRYSWDKDSTYVQNPPYFDGMGMTPPPVTDITGARVLAVLGNSITTDHISPAGSIKESSAAGKYLIAHGVEKKDFNSYGARRGNHEVMMRGTFANGRIRNALIPKDAEGNPREGGITRHLPDGEEMSIYDAAMKYQSEGVPLIILAGTEYGSGSSRDWAAKGPRLLGVRAVIAESYERIHRSNLVGMGIVPLQFLKDESAASHELTGEEVFDVAGLADGLAAGFARGSRTLTVTATAADGSKKAFQAIARIDTPQEVLYYKHGGILQYVLRQLAGRV